MKKKLFLLLLSFVLLSTFANAHVQNFQHNNPPSYKEQKIIDKHYKERLNLSDEQVEVLKDNRREHRKQMEKILKRMEILHNEIRDVYLLGLPKFQTDIRTASQKAELVLLKQNAQNLKKQYNKTILDVLSDEQKAQFLKIKEENKAK